jgi:hypothetical protein
MSSQKLASKRTVNFDDDENLEALSKPGNTSLQRSAAAKSVARQPTEGQNTANNVYVAETINVHNEYNF